MSGLAELIFGAIATQQAGDGGKELAGIFGTARAVNRPARIETLVFARLALPGTGVELMPAM